MQRLEVSGAVRPLQWSLGVKGLKGWKADWETEKKGNFMKITLCQ